MLQRWPAGRFVSALHSRSVKRGVLVKKICTPISHLSITRVLQSDNVPLRKQLKATAKAEKQKTRTGGSRLLDEERAARLQRWQLTVGIEIHAQLNTASKLFSSASAEYSDLPNTTIASFDLAVPGSQPVLQLDALIPALRAAIALKCTIQASSSFDRKHYFYHDQPAGYQITQYYSPFAKDGSLALTHADGLAAEEDEIEVGIKQVQLEQDTARTQEQDGTTSLIDYNRSGHALIEIISLPHIHTATAAASYVRKVAAMLQAVDAVTTGMELGGLRADVNVSVSPKDDSGAFANTVHSYGGVTNLGQRTEIKNLSSPSAVLAAVTAEYDRQTQLLESGQRVEGETRGWSLSSPNTTTRLRGKEGEVDYRYMPDPDITPLFLSEEIVDHFYHTLPPLPADLRRMLEVRYELSSSDAETLCALNDGDRLLYYQDVVARLLSGSEYSDDQQASVKVQAANYVLHEIGALLTTSMTEWTAGLVGAQQMADLVGLHHEGKLTGTSAKQLLKTLFEGDKASVADIAARDNLLFEAMSDEEYQALISQVLEANPSEVQVAREDSKKSAGKIKFLLGQVMRVGDRNRIEVKKAESLLRNAVLEAKVQT